MSLEVSDILPGGWTTLSVQRIRFPRACCRCGAETASQVEFSGDARFSLAVLLRQLAALRRAVVVPVPLCDDCQRARRRRKLAGAVLGATLAGGLVAVALWVSPLERLGVSSDVIGIWAGVIALAAFLGAQAGWIRFGGREPVRLRWWSAEQGTVQAWFERAAYREQVRELNSRDDGQR